MKPLLKSKPAQEWADLKQVFRTHWLLSVSSIVVLVGGVVGFLIPQLFPALSAPGLDAWVGTCMDNSPIGVVMTALLNAATQTFPRETYKFATMPGIAHAMFSLLVPVAAIIILIYWFCILVGADIKAWASRKFSTKAAGFYGP